MTNLLVSRFIGYVASLILTLAAFLIVIRPEFFHLSTRANVIAILALAIFQAIVQSICFLHILSEKGPRWNLLIFVSTISMVIIIVAFTIWVMNHLNYNMMP